VASSSENIATTSISLLPTIAKLINIKSSTNAASQTTTSMSFLPTIATLIDSNISITAASHTTAFHDGRQTSN
jgi:hypothetical protein